MLKVLHPNSTMSSDEKMYLWFAFNNVDTYLMGRMYDVFVMQGRQIVMSV